MRDALIETTQLVAEATADLRLGDKAEAHLVAHHDYRAPARRDRDGNPRPHAVAGLPRADEPGDPERQRVEENDVSSGAPCDRLSEIGIRLHGPPRPWARPPVRGDASVELGFARPGGGDEGDKVAAERLRPLDGIAALPARRATDHKMQVTHETPAPRRPGMRRRR